MEDRQARCEGPPLRPAFPVLLLPSRLPFVLGRRKAVRMTSLGPASPLTVLPCLVDEKGQAVMRSLMGTHRVAALPAVAPHRANDREFA